MSGPLLYLVAGEPSGDRLGAALMRALAAEAPGVRFAGVGGREMRAAGLAPLFDIAELSVMGITEVLPRLPAILCRMGQVTADVLSRRPAALVTIDAPSFGLRVAARVRARDPSIRTIHYVAPSVWAWRPGRAARMARFTDHVLALLPFEPPFMQAAGMTCDFVGHPVAERPPVSAQDRAAFRSARGIGPAQPLLLLAPGSRRGEVGRLMPVFAQVLAALRPRHPDLAVALPVAETVEAELRALAGGLAIRPRLVLPEEGEAAKLAAFAAADAGLIASGTVGLELAAAGTPHVSTYRTSWLTAAIARRLLRVDTGHLVNLVLGEKIVPECLQEGCTAAAILPRLEPLLAPGAAEAAAQRAAFGRALAALGAGGVPPSVRAARSVLARI